MTKTTPTYKKFMEITGPFGSYRYFGPNHWHLKRHGDWTPIQDCDVPAGALLSVLHELEKGNS